MSRVVLAMSGGVDSSVAAHLLVRAGHEVIGVFMRHGGPPRPAIACAMPGETVSATSLPIVPPAAQHKQGCCSAQDAEDARRVAADLGIPFYPLNLQDGFASIMDYFAETYLQGRTPNPCVMCNNWLKFGRLFDYADAVEADYVATGHYAQLESNGRHPPRLMRAVDQRKDQSYVLFGVRRDRLPRMLLPVGSYQKAEIRRLAFEFGLRVADKPDSQEICFVPSGDHAEFIHTWRPACATAGELVTTDGEVVGYHDGIERFTVGQRRGLRVALGDPYYVVRIEPASRRVVLGRREELACRSLQADRVNWLSDPPPKSLDCQVQIRYQSAPLRATATPASTGELHVEFHAPCLGVAPGQAVVCYDDEQVLGGGWIVSSQPAGGNPSADAVRLTERGTVARATANRLG